MSQAQKQENTQEFNPTKFTRNLFEAFLKYQEGTLELLKNQNVELPPLVSNEEVGEINSSILKFWSDARNTNNEVQKLLHKYSDFMQGLMKNPKDRQFAHEAWETNPTLYLLRSAYNVNSNWCKEFVENLNNIKPHTKHKLKFYTEQLLDAASPANVPYINPAVIDKAIQTEGESISNGASNFLKDVEKNPEMLQVSSYNDKEFEVGKNLAITKGKVVYQNKLMQLIQYEPTTKTVYETPTLIITAWINKYYILDLQEKNSLVKWLLDHGHTVFLISWVNPDESYSDVGLNDYLSDGALTAIEQALKLTGVKKLNCLGYCLGGTLLACAASYLAAHKKDLINSLTFLTTLVDFEDVGDVKVFIDEPQVKFLEETMCKKGYMDGSNMRGTFSTMKAKDMVWSFVINNYYLGNDPVAFDILYWNSDSTRLPAAMHSEYLRSMYLNNALKEQGGLELLETPLDLRKVNAPTYILSTHDDHIAPWQSTFKATSIYSGPVKFVLSGSGHVAGIVNPPANNKYYYFENDKLSENPNEWLNGAKKYEGSWWKNWENWLKAQSGKQIGARNINQKLVVEDAPGSYVKAK